MNQLATYNLAVNRASPKQIKYAKRLGVWRDDMTMEEMNYSITKAQAEKLGVWNPNLTMKEVKDEIKKAKEWNKGIEDDIFYYIYKELGAGQLRKNGSEHHVPCPSCGAGHNDNGKKGFSPFSYGEAFFCFSCGIGGNLHQLADILKIYEKYGYTGTSRSVALPPKGERAKPKPKPEEPPKEWNFQTDMIIERMTSHPNKYNAWHAYRPQLKPESIDRFRLGFDERMPDSDFYSPRVIVPVYALNPATRTYEVINFSGRNPRASADDGLKWRQAGGALKGNSKFLYRPEAANNEGVKMNPLVVILENFADACLLRQMVDEDPRIARDFMVYMGIAEPGLIPPMLILAPSQTSHWADEYTKKIAKLGAVAVLVCYDNDLGGVLCNEKQQNYWRAIFDFESKRARQGKKNIKWQGKSGFAYVKESFDELAPHIPCLAWEYGADTPLKDNIVDILRECYDG